MRINSVTAREVLDSRGTPTVMATVTLENGITGSAISPSGASTGAHEAHERRDTEDRRFYGKGVLDAVDSVNKEISDLLCGNCVMNQYEIDSKMIQSDGTENKSRYGANAILAVSLACAHSAAASLGIPLFQYIGGINGRVLPRPMLNIINGGAHSSNNLDIQEFMIMPLSAPDFREGLRMSVEVFQSLKKVLTEKGQSTGVGDEGGFAPTLSCDEEAIELILTAIDRAGYRGGDDFAIALDAAANEWYSDGKYILPKQKTEYSRDTLCERWCSLCDKYPIGSIEDPFSEDDYEGFKKLTSLCGKRVTIVGDDLFVTNKNRLMEGIRAGAANAILIKPNQIGTLSETIDTVRLAKNNGYATIMSHRSGESEDTTIADLAVGLCTGQIKTGAPSRGERIAKYNRLLCIEDALKK